MCGATPTNGNAATIVNPERSKVKALERASINRPAIENATIAPAAIAIKAVPTSPELRSSLSFIEGIREIHEARVNPFTRKIVETAIRACRCRSNPVELPPREELTCESTATESALPLC